MIVSNRAYERGGGVFGGTLFGCQLTGNHAGEGGAAYASVLHNCTLMRNTAPTGGGACSSALDSCSLTENSASNGGGAAGSTLVVCTVSNNKAWESGGATTGCTLYSCSVTGNQAWEGGGGDQSSTLFNCTVTGNTAIREGGGVRGSVLYNCIVYHNTAPDGPNYSEATFEYSCANPLPPGVGNIAVDPQLASATHLSITSPCINAGSNAYSRGVDIDHQAWTVPPCIGADQVVPSSLFGPLVVDIVPMYSQVLVGVPVVWSATIDGPVTGSVWDFGDGTMLTNCPYVNHQWTNRGTYIVRLTVFNRSFPQGVLDTRQIEVVEHVVHYVNGANPAPAFPFTTWASAANSIQDAVDAAAPGALVLVTDGTYNRITVDKPLTVSSVNGPASTAIVGYGLRCAALAGHAILSGFTLTNGFAYLQDGGGVWCDSSAVVTNCVITGNSSYTYWDDGWQMPGGSGGGVHGGNLYNCTLSGNRAIYGGGAHGSTLHNCTLTGNPDGGAAGSTLYNCIAYFNPGFNAASCSLTHSCSIPIPTNGIGNITNEPVFVNLAGGDLHLQSNSPCINAGANGYVSSGIDLDGNPRIAGGTVDIGAYEFQNPSSTISYAWLQQYGLPTDGSADFTDADGDLLNNQQEWTADTNPTNAGSALRITSIAYPPLVEFTFHSSASRTYSLTRCANLEASVWSLVPGATDIPGTGAALTLTDTNFAPPSFYRVSVRLP